MMGLDGRNIWRYRGGIFWGDEDNDNLVQYNYAM